MIFGLDLGTTNSCIALYRDEIAAVDVLQNEAGKTTTPSAITFLADERIVGEAALENSRNGRSNTITDAKRLIGQPYTMPGLAELSKSWPF